MCDAERKHWAQARRETKTVSLTLGKSSTSKQYSLNLKHECIEHILEKKRSLLREGTAGKVRPVKVGGMASKEVQEADGH